MSATTTETEECMEGVKAGRAQVRDGRDMRPCPKCSAAMCWQSLLCAACFDSVPEALQRAYLLADWESLNTAGRAVLRAAGCGAEAHVPGLRLPSEELRTGYYGRYRSAARIMGQTAVCAGCGKEGRRRDMEGDGDEWWHGACLERAAAAEYAAVGWHEGEHKETKGTERTEVGKARAVSLSSWCLTCGAGCASNELQCRACRAKH